MKICILTLLPLLLGIPLGSTAGLRNNRRKLNEDDDTGESIECFVTEVSPITPPDREHMEPRLLCRSEKGGILHDYYLDGNTTAFFQDNLNEDHEDLLASGRVKISVPTSIVNNSSIFFDDNSASRISISYDESRKLAAQNAVGTKKVLIVRISDDYSSDRKVALSGYELKQNIFFDENNLAMVYKKCSNNKLIFQPSYDDADRGVLEIKAPWNICNTLWWDVTNEYISFQPWNYEADHFMFVMPDCVDWQQAAGWGETPGRYTWFPSEFVHLPVSQVHEMGHNFGHRHSGKNGKAYADDTGYMGNMAKWTDQGSAMCFNPAKTWFFNWYSDRHKTVKVSSSEFVGNLVSFAQIGSAVWDDYVVVKVQNEKSIYKDNLFIHYNLAVGANAGVVGDQNLIVITMQDKHGAQSTWIAALGAGQSHTIYNWGYSQHLVIKVCSISNSWPKRAKLVLAFQGSSALSCSRDIGNDQNNNNNSNNNNQNWVKRAPNIFRDTSYFLQTDPIVREEISIEAPTSIGSIHANEVCEDISGWHDADGEEYNCNWYASGHSGDRCRFASDHPYQGHTAKSACCTCGGGNEVELYDLNICQDTAGWHDSAGKDCEWYEKYPSRCLNLGNKFHGMFGQTANEACCYCKVGR